MCVNVQSLISNLAHVEIIIAEQHPHLLICTEARITTDIYDSEIRITGYKLVRSNSPSRHSGGVVMYIRTDVIFKVITNVINEYDNFLFVDIINSPFRGIWGGIYHSPSSSDATFIDSLENILEDLSTINRPLSITGDFNINVHDNNPVTTYKLRLKAVERNFCIKQVVKKFTRVTDSSSTIVDHVYTNNETLKVDVSDVDCVADHRMLVCVKKSNNRNYQTKRIIDRSALNAENFKPICFRNFIKVFCCDADFQTRASNFVKQLEAAACSLVKFKDICISYAKRWFTPELNVLRCQKNEANIAAALTNEEPLWQEYRVTKNKYNRKIKAAKNRDLVDMIHDAQDDQKKLWRHLKNFIDCKDKLPSCMIFDGVSVTDNKVIANKLNLFFIKSIADIQASIPHVPYSDDVTEREINEWSEFGRMSIATVRRILKNVKSNSGVNNVNKTVMSYALDVEPFEQSIINLYNESLATGSFPDEWKVTVVTPIPKVKDTDDPNLMRPVNSCQINDKIIQTFVKEELETHIYNNKLIDDNQSAYRAKHSCETALNLVINEWIMCKERKRRILAVFIDLSRAFETVDRIILLQVLLLLGITGTVHKWFKSWLTGRKQYTVFNGEKSDPIGVDTGIPQGTPLSSILFILYINSIVHCLKWCRIKMFADDILLWLEFDNISEAIEKMNADLERITTFLKMMKLKLNVNKSKFMVFAQRGDQYECEILFDGQKLERVNEIKYLGILIDDQLSFKPFADYVVKKIAKKISFLRRIRNKLTLDSSLLLFKVLVAPHYDFCSSILFLMNEQQLNQLQILQNRALRIVLKARRDTHVTTMLNRTNMLSIKQRINYNVILLIYKAVNHLLPEYLSSQLRYVSDLQPYVLRNNRNLRPPQLKTKIGQKSIFYKGVIMFNELRSKGVDTECSLKQFKVLLSEYVKDNY